MDASTLRWILIIFGLVIIGLILLFGNPEKKKRPRASRRKQKAKDARVRREPTLGPSQSTGAGSSGDDSDGAQVTGDQGELEIDGAKASAPADKPKRPPPPEPDRIVTLYLVARDNRMITGAELLEAAVKTGMDFGELSIFHRTVEGDSRSVFSLANAAKPGQFDRSKWHEFETGALVLFTTLPNPLSALDAWDAMLATARRMADILGGELHDENHHPFSRRREAQFREEMRDYDRQHIAKHD